MIYIVVCFNDYNSDFYYEKFKNQDDTQKALKADFESIIK